MAASGGIWALLLAIGVSGPVGTGTVGEDNPASPPGMSMADPGTPGRLWLGLSVHSCGAHYALGGEWTPWRPFYFSLPLDGLITVDIKISRPMPFPSGDEAPPEGVVPVGPD